MSPAMHCLLVPAIGAEATEVLVRGAEARHAARSRRIGPGERVLLSDGRGTMAEGVAKVADANVVGVAVETIRHVPRPVLRLRLALGIIKGDRMALALAQATEAGVDEIIPIEGDRSVVRLSADRSLAALERWQRCVAEATKQARRAWLPEVLPVQRVADFLRAAGEAGLAGTVALDPDAPRALPGVVSELVRAEVDAITLVVGPEGGLSGRETAELQRAGVVSARLGSEVMRSGTAALAGLAVVSSMGARWQTGDRD